VYDDALKYLKQMFGGAAEFRDGQWEAIQLTINNKKALIVQQTGWGEKRCLFYCDEDFAQQGERPNGAHKPAAFADEESD
jgi:ATP-dependent DNA helicase RecQ